MQTQGYVSRFEPLIYVPAFTRKDFHYVHTGPSTKGPPPRNYDLHTGSTQLQLSLTPLHKKQHKVKKKLQLGDHLDHKQSLGDLERRQTQPLTIQNLRGQICNEKLKYVSAQNFWKRKHKENSQENSKNDIDIQNKKLES